MNRWWINTCACIKTKYIRPIPSGIHLAFAYSIHYTPQLQCVCATLAKTYHLLRRIPTKTKYLQHIHYSFVVLIHFALHFLADLAKQTVVVKLNPNLNDSNAICLDLPELYSVYAVNLGRISRNHYPMRMQLVLVKRKVQQKKTETNTANKLKRNHSLWLDQIDIRKAHWIVLSYHADRYRHLSNVVGMILLCIVVNHFRMTHMEKIDETHDHSSLMDFARRAEFRATVWTIRCRWSQRAWMKTNG